MKLEGFYMAKETVTRLKGQPTHWERLHKSIPCTGDFHPEYVAHNLNTNEPIIQSIDWLVSSVDSSPKGEHKWPVNI